VSRTERGKNNVVTVVSERIGERRGMGSTIRAVGVAGMVLALVFTACGRESQAPTPVSESSPAPSTSAPPVSMTSAIATPPGAPISFPMIGSTFPGFQSSRLDGKMINLGNLKGKVILINLWATWCGPCRAEIPDLEALYQKEKSKGFELAGITVDSAGTEKAVAEFVKQEKMTYPVFLDPDGRSTLLLKTSVIPTSAMIDRNGKVVWYHAGMVQTTDPEFQKVLKDALGG
jgi:thiol-disulfide isomerase/thioredoxin